MRIPSFFKLGVIGRLSLGLIAMAISLFLIADIIFGILPNQEITDQTNRKYIAKSLAIQLVSLIENNDRKMLNTTIQQVTVRNPGIMSIGIRESAGRLTYQTPNHKQYWLLLNNESSTTNNIRVPINDNKTLWGSVEISFKSNAPQSLAEWIVQSQIVWLGIIGMLGSGIIYAYLSRAMHYLDPSKSVPSRVNIAFDIITDGILVLDKQGQIVLANDAFKKLSDTADGDLFGKKISELLLTKPLLNQLPNSVIPWEIKSKDSHDITDISLNTVNKDNEPLSLLVSSVTISDDTKEPKGYLVTFKNISELQKTNHKLNTTLSELQTSRAELEVNNQQLQEMAYRDSLTGCLNRRAFFQQAEDLFILASQGNRELHCIMADIDLFKSFNDIYGHHIGDQVIQTVAKILNSSMRPTDLLCRYGGEEFCILLSDLSEEKAFEVCERMRLTIEETANKSIRSAKIKQITSSFGIASINSGAHSIENLIDYADSALYMSKESGRNKSTKWMSSLLN